MDEKRFRIDFIIAVGALLISTITALSSIYQTRIIARQFSATVWPYISFDTTNSPSLVEVDLRNDGLGPAIVRSASITLEGKPQASLEALLALLAARDPRTVAAIRASLRAGRGIKVTTSTPTAGLVIPANTVHTVLRMEGAVLKQRFGPALKRVGLSLCYCSLTGSCWTQTFQNRTGEPHAVSSCSTRG